MGKYNFNIGDKVSSKRVPGKTGVIVEYYDKTGKFKIRLENGNIHFESPRWLEKAAARIE
ncbi:hypothetical protein EHM76_07440 [bacterium]|nr:MAG: hypothetical protein EHM76_07440 [bacterium]